MKTSKTGYTLIELLAGIFISAIVLAGLCSVFTSQQMAYSAQEQVAEMTQNIRAGLDLMTREIRLAGYRNSASTFSGIQTAGPATIRILADLDQNGDTLGTDEDITYTFNSGTLQICRNGASWPIADNITSLSFDYTMDDETVTSSPSNPANIKKVKISISARTRFPDRLGVYRTITLSTDVTPRNLAS